MQGARPAGPADLPRLAALVAEATEATSEARGGHLYGRPARSRAPSERLAQAFDNPDMLVLGGTVDNYVVGVALVSIDRLTAATSTGVVEELYVEPDARGVGVGEALLDAAVLWCRQAGCTGVDMAARPGDRATKNLCERSGFSARVLWMHRPL